MSQQAQMIQGKTGLWEVVIGLEVHAQISSHAKLFSGASTAFGAEPNAHVSLVDAAFPGMLPVINAVCVEQAVRTGIGLNAHVNTRSVFDRKNYFYADLPQGYQISQFTDPIVSEGHLDIDLDETKTKRIRIERLHLEQDAGKSIHDMHPTKTFIDLNRSGVALMEIVTYPDMRTPEEAMAFMKKLRALLRALKTCDGNMDQGSMRADVNISLHRPDTPFGTRAEIKNVNSIRFMGQAIRYEIERQMDILERGGTVDQETRLYDPVKTETRSMRSKEDAHDYRYFPDPDLPPLVIEQSFIDNVRLNMPELPEHQKEGLIRDHGLSAYDASLIVAEEESYAYFMAMLAASQTWADKGEKVAKLLANWMLVEFFALCNKNDLAVTHAPVGPESLAELVDLIVRGEISGRIAKDVFPLMWETGKSASDIVAEKGLKQVSDSDALQKAIAQIMVENPDKVNDYKGGNDKLFGWFVGQIMKATQGQGNPQIINALLKKALSQ
ncbi:MAG: Asp-tRNA(Asn)/Glu-tRNA(Gln) amidotransferase subunit GatB [Alphaproteobacteria bacterium]|nr:MAG: Asp-tRNA(Asn)/Glu-tRNA(Gln) amidotransferase subunit GatB [Alphaproteobacteria bacterium]